MFRVEDRAPVTEPVKAAGKRGGLKLGPGGSRPPPGPPARAVETEQQPHQQRGGGVGQVEQHPHPAAAEHPRPHHPQDEGGAGVVAEGQQALRLRLGAQAVLVEGMAVWAPTG